MINIGKISGTHHLNGDVKISTGFNEFEILLNQKLFLELKDKSRILTLKNFQKMTDKKYILTFEEIQNINEAKEIVDFNIFVRRDLLPIATKDEYYISDLVTFDIVENDTIIGNVVDFLETAAHDILIVSNNDKEFMIPFVYDVFIKEIDFDNKKIFVNLIEGLI